MSEIEIRIKPEAPEPGPMLSIKDLKRLLGVSMNTASRLMKALPHVDIAPPGNTYALLRMRREVFDAFIEERSQAGSIEDG